MLTMDTQRQIIAQPKTQNKVTTKVCWTDAFLIFLGVYTNAHPQKSQQIAKYLHDIRNWWVTYDEQFRLKMSKNASQDWGGEQ